MRACLADNFISEFTAKVILDCLLLWGALDCSLESVQEHSQILFDVHLLEHIYWLALPVFECMAVIFGVDVHFLGQEEPSE